MKSYRNLQPPPTKMKPPPPPPPPPPSQIGQPIPYTYIGGVYYDEKTKELIWHETGWEPIKSDKLGTLEDIDDAFNNLKVVITKKALNGEL